jgi:foldase protein PrsA
MRTLACLAVLALLALPALSAIQEKTEPGHVTVQHILIAFRGSLPDPKVTRSREDAEKLALKIFERAKAGEDFDAMVKTYTNDSYPGIYKMSNRDVPPDTSTGEFSRTRMVKAFGDVSFGLEVGGVGLAVYDPATSKYGWHIIKRLE